MTTNEYLQKVLEDQTFKADSDELKQLREHRSNVEALLRKTFSDSDPTIRYGGSKAKGTMIREKYDLDVICYFNHDDTKPGETLKDIYQNTQQALAAEYDVQAKTSALRLRSRDPETLGVDFHIDVVPGRFTEDKDDDVFLYISSGDKCRLKTNLQKHIAHIRDSGLTDAIRLTKLWAFRNGIYVKTFVLELTVIEVLAGKDGKDLDVQLVHLWEHLQDHSDDIKIEDPANPSGNDLSELFNDSVRSTLAATARMTLSTIEQNGWEAVFGKVEKENSARRIEIIERTAAAVASPTKPWASTR